MEVYAVTENRSTKPSMFSVFRNRAFTSLWVGELISGMGSALTTLAASILVFRVTGSALSVGLMLIATAGPTILVGLVAGVLVDRYDRKRILVISDLLRAVLILLIPFLIPFNILWLYILVALASAVTQFFDSAHASILPEVATDEELSAANSLMAISSVGSTTIGFAAAGLIVSGFNINWAFYINALTFIISAGFILITRVPNLPKVEDTSLKAIGQNLRAGLRVVRDVPILRSLFIVVIPIFLIFGLQNALFLPFALKALGGTEFEFGLQQAAEAIGVVLGSLMMARLADRIREGQWLVISYLMMALASLAYSFSTTMSLAIFLVGVSGFVNAPSFIGRQLVIQRATPREMRGRVNSAFFVVRDVMFVFGMSMAGLADIMNVRLLFLVSSIAMMAAGAVALVMPGLGQPISEWKRTLDLLRGVEAAPRLGAGRSAAVPEIDLFISHRPELNSMLLKERQQLAANTLVADVPGGKIVVYRGESSNAAYFILRGSVGVGYIKDDEYVILNYLKEGDFFGEVASLTGRARTANVITEEESQFLIIPSKVMRQLAEKYKDLNEVFLSTMVERLSQTELPLGTSLDQNLLRELRTNSPKAES
jgi:MFS transporter, DHA3 family, macrolide efflux protein